MMVGGNINSNTKIRQHQVATLLMKTAPAAETTTPRQWSYNNEKSVTINQWCETWWRWQQHQQQHQAVVLLMTTAPDVVQIMTRKIQQWKQLKCNNQPVVWKMTTLAALTATWVTATPCSATTDNDRPAVETNAPSSKGQHSNAGLTATAHSLQSPPILWQQLRLSSDDDGNSSLLTGWI